MYSFIAIFAMDYHIDLQMQRYEKYPTWQNKSATFCKKKESAPKLMGHPRVLSVRCNLFPSALPNLSPRPTPSSLAREERSIDEAGTPLLQRKNGSAFPADRWNR
jgi:hypothetical protein